MLGAFVGDAAAMPTHWIYDPAEMLREVPSVEAPEFKNPATPRFYSSSEFPGHYESGSLSPYGEQLLFVSQWLAEAGEVSGTAMAGGMATWAATYSGRKDHALKSFEENVAKGATWPECGADDNQAHCYMKVVPATALYAGSPERRAKVEEAIRVHQNNDVAVEFGLVASDILERVFLGESLADALAAAEATAGPAVKSAFDKARADLSLNDLLKEISHEVMKDKPDSPFYDLAGRSCALPGSFIAPLSQLIRLSRQDDPADAFAATSRENIVQAAGDTCSRAVFLGAVVAAAYGPPPTTWIDKLSTAFDYADTAHPVKPLLGLIDDLTTKITSHNQRCLAPDA